MRGQRTDDRGQTTEDGRQTTEDGRQTTEDGRQTTEDGRQTTKNRLLYSIFCVLPSVFCLLFSVFCLLVLTAGCQNTAPSIPPWSSQIERLSREKTQLQSQLKQSNAENEQLKKQIEVLSALPKDQRDLWSIQRIEIGRLSGLHDENKDGKKEKLIVYVQPIDKDGDTVKAPGAVDVQLWDLNKKGGQALVSEWHIGPDQLKKLWLTALLAGNYKLTFDVAEKTELFKEPLTIKVAFTDYLTGKTFQEQKLIKP